jgi:hypothetical protein
MVESTYFVSTPTDLAIAKNNEEKKNERYCMELGLVHSNKNLKAQLNYLSPLI